LPSGNVSDPADEERRRGTIVFRFGAKEPQVNGLKREFELRRSNLQTERIRKSFRHFGMLILCFVGIVAPTGSVFAQGPVFIPTGSMITARTGHTETLLNNGMVLIAGGETSSAELYNPATGTFTATGSMTTSRTGHTATLLNNGTVLITGGSSPGILSSAELYDPAIGTFTATGSMTIPRNKDTATLLSNGTVLIAGGLTLPSDSVTPSAELYEPLSGTFAATGNMMVGVEGHTATLLTSGKVLIVGGQSTFANVLTAELYDPVSGTFSATGSLTTGRVFHTATLLNNGQALIAGGTSDGNFSLSSVELYDPAAGTFSATGNLLTSRWGQTATLLKDGDVLVAGGTSTDGNNTNVFPLGAELYVPGAGIFAEAGNMTTSRLGQSATLLSNGQVLLAGGEIDPGLETLTASAELYDPPVSPLVALSSSSLTFTSQMVGTSSPQQQVMLTNAGSAALIPMSISVSGVDSADFVQSNTCTNSLSPAATCSISVEFAPAAGGPRNASLIITDNASGSPQSIPLSGAASDFSVSASPASQTVSPGQTAIYPLAIATNGSFNGTLALSCTGLPALSTCTLSPNSVSLNGSSPVTATAFIATAASSFSLRGPERPFPTRQFLTTVRLLLLVLSVSLLVKPLEGRGARLVLTLRLSLLCSVLAISACGGGGTGGKQAGGTPPGSYTISVSATFSSGSTSITRNTSLTLVVR
jgi:hypothetical protein